MPRLQPFLLILGFCTALLFATPGVQAQQGTTQVPEGGADAVATDSSLHGAASDSVAAAKRESVRQMMRLTRADQMAQQVMARTLMTMQRRQSHVPDAWWQRFAQKIDTGALMERLVPIYAEHFTHDEIRQLIAFYETPLGQKVIRQMPHIMQKSMTVGEQWGQRLAREVMQELKEDGHVET